MGSGNGKRENMGNGRGGELNKKRVETRNCKVVQEWVTLKRYAMVSVVNKGSRLNSLKKKPNLVESRNKEERCRD